MIYYNAIKLPMSMVLVRSCASQTPVTCHMMPCCAALRPVVKVFNQDNIGPDPGSFERSKGIVLNTQAIGSVLGVETLKLRLREFDMTANGLNLGRY